MAYDQTKLKILNILGFQINPATEEKQDEIITAISESWVSSNIDIEDATNYYFLSFIPNTTKWRINQLNKTTYVSGYKVGDSDINLAWDDRTTYLYDIIY